MKILIVRPNDRSKEFYNKFYNEIQRNKPYDIDVFYITDYLDKKLVKAEWLDELYRNKNSKLMKMYSDFKKIAKDYDIVISTTYNVLHPDFLFDNLKNVTYLILAEIDGPMSSYIRTVPYVHGFDFAYSISPICNSEGYSFPQRLKDWGVNDSAWVPILNVAENKDLSIENIHDKERNIDLIYIGNASTKKLPNLRMLKKEFKNKFKLYGRFKYFGYEGLLKSIYFKQPLFYWRISSIGANEYYNKLISSKIGFNMHLEDNNVGNRRLYDLALNGVMQICDEGANNAVSKIFKPGEEIVTYKNMDEAIEKIKYYLKHDDERKRIAVNGFKRAKKEYTPPKIFNKMVLEILYSMRNRDIVALKSGIKIDIFIKELELVYEKSINNIS
ncbi:Spore maturation protein CgeB [Orenia metallireducens]|uniref:Spore maturation protein CgeB n=1 Tax=Orenia metallireducens TaxID=1413210 RepID=A0A285FVK3_9FIRM|nr:glycosyltransferase [Orenia metallireducens]SNY15309.1 Spore maturation protein CgeB [Orenia metallireducens]